MVTWRNLIKTYFHLGWGFPSTCLLILDLPRLAMAMSAGEPHQVLTKYVLKLSQCTYDDIIKWRCFTYYSPFVWGYTSYLWIPSTKGEWCKFVIFFVVSMTKPLERVPSPVVADLRHHDAQVMSVWYFTRSSCCNMLIIWDRPVLAFLAPTSFNHLH